MKSITVIKRKLDTLEQELEAMFEEFSKESKENIGNSREVVDSDMSELLGKIEILKWVLR
jgi:hypothetical protein